MINAFLFISFKEDIADMFMGWADGAMVYYAIPQGVQAVTHISGSDSLVIIANPDNDDAPTIYERHGVDQANALDLHKIEV